MLSADGASTMAFFSSGSRALVEILTRMQSAERPMPVDHTFFEFGSIRYHVEASASDPENVYLSISTPSLSHEAAPSSTGLPEATLQETRKAYHKFAEVVEPPREGYVLTLKLNFSGLARPKDRVKAINQVSLLQSVVLSSQLRDMLGSLGPFGTMKLVYSQREPFFVSNTKIVFLHPLQAEKIHAIFPMRFRDDTDLAIATSFFQELQDLGNSFARAPRCSWSPIPPPELRGEHVDRLTTNGGFVSFGVLSRHVRGKKRAAKTAWILLNFQAYVKYHIKCTRSHIQSRMRQRLEALTEVIQDASLRGNHDKTRSQGSRSRVAREAAGVLVSGFQLVNYQERVLSNSNGNRRSTNPPRIDAQVPDANEKRAAWHGRCLET
ncbi:actin-related protein 2/3 complex subunit 2B-like isoform X3 [Panicum hallii]|uniref:actin-related protein 2/3 complex subunit 2B-like isoform X3 n=1 Tax=Panicum hallii TaxID=206008 RepID=UPI000DF4E4C4|nr:actin-related protein 2/3 complex subunit 2B-like isoform X3 [Panicum hallii]